MFSPLFDLSFWFNLAPSAFSPTFERAFFLLFGVMVIIGAIVRIVARHRKEDRYLRKTFQSIGQMLVTMGILGMLWFFFSFEGIYMLGARFWFLVWAAGLVYWIIAIVRFAKITVPHIKEEASKRSEQNKYLPRKRQK